MRRWPSCLVASRFAMKLRSVTCSAVLFLLSTAPLVTCGGTIVVENTTCQAACEQANQCQGRVADCTGLCGVRASLDMVAGCSDADSPELAGLDVAFMGV